MTAFEYAWSVLKALPEQQAYTESFRHSPHFGDEPSTSQQRLGTIPPPIMGALGREQWPARQGSGLFPEADRQIYGPPWRGGGSIENPNTRVSNNWDNEMKQTYGHGHLESAPNRTPPGAGWNLSHGAGAKHPIYGPANFTTTMLKRPDRRQQPLDTDAIYAYLQSIGF